jgi:hypothetical protein
MSSSAESAFSIPVSRHGFAEVKRNSTNDQQGLFSLRHVQPGEELADFSAGVISAAPTYLTVQVGVGKHITLEPSFLQYINHGCDPNVFFDTTTMKLLALREIQPGEEFRFFYPSTEWKMAQSFSCSCGSPRCIGKIRGAFYLSPALSAEYRLTDFIRQQLAKKNARKKVA